MSNARLFDFEGLNENFSFLMLKIHQQLEDTLIALQQLDGFVPERMKNSLRSRIKRSSTV